MFLMVVILSFRECHSWCTADQVSENSLGCTYKGNFIPKGVTKSFYQPECVRCSCSETMHSCCSIGITITSVGPECEIVQEGCTQRAVLKSDSSEACSTVTAIGR
ncbi:uncharacterized protein LOC134714086 [Mytilus trossulus]|uniref:uncharacterized protein LOC134714086 n=1 Tax=Mytilus trossulus TaxID=6551 RepID=UPI00300721E1